MADDTIPVGPELVIEPADPEPKTADKLRAEEKRLGREREEAVRRLGVEKIPLDMELGKLLQEALGLKKRKSGWEAAIKEFIPFLAQEVPAYEMLVQIWDRTSEKDRRMLRPEDFLASAGIAPEDFISDLTRVVFVVSRQKAALMIASGQPGVVRAAIKNAKTPEGGQDRKMLMQSAGLAPKPKGQEAQGISVHIDARGGEVAIDGPKQEGPYTPFEQDATALANGMREMTRRKALGAGEEEEDK
jgi:hypothetical protein